MLKEIERNRNNQCLINDIRLLVPQNVPKYKRPNYVYACEHWEKKLNKFSNVPLKGFLIIENV